MRTGLMIAMTLLACSALAETVELTAEQDMPVDLSGVWNLDYQSGEEFAEKMDAVMEEVRQQMSQRGGGGQGGRGGGGKGGRGMGHGGGGGVYGDEVGPSGGQHPQNDRGMTEEGGRDLEQALSQLLIIVYEGQIEIMDGSDVTIIWKPDGKPMVQEAPHGNIARTAHWDKEVLVLETRGGRMNTTRRLHLSEQGKRLDVEVAVEIPATRQSVRATLTYHGY